MIDRDVIEIQQKQILDAIFKENESVQVSDSSLILKDIQSFHPSIVVGTLGSVGQKLLRFCNSIDLDNPHPDISKLCDGAFVDSEGSFGSILVDLLDVKEFCDSQGICSYIKDSLSNIVYEHPSWALIKDNIDDPFSNLRNVRFVKSREDRDQIRSMKSSQGVGFNQFIKEESQVWEPCPDSFESFVRGKNIYEQDVQEAKSRIEHMNKFRLNAMAGEIEKYLKELNRKMAEEMCFGFNQINLHLTAAILGKQLGADISIKARPYGMNETKAYIQVSEFTIEYSPTCYPLINYWDKTSQRVKQVVDYLESFPELKNKPVFDHFRVVIPSPINNVGVLLGEKEGIHYFVCYWEAADGFDA